MEEFISLKELVHTLIFSALGILIMGLSIWIFDKITPHSIWKEVADNKNTAVAIVVGALILGIAIIIGFAAHE